MGKDKSLKNYINGTYTQADKQVLKKAGYLVKKKYPQKEVVRMIVERDFKRCVPKTCEWCNKKTLILHNHHFPIPKGDGGTEIVKICPTCHFEYHLLIEGNCELSDSLEVL